MYIFLWRRNVVSPQWLDNNENDFRLFFIVDEQKSRIDADFKSYDQTSVISSFFPLDINI